tara:strand:- start:114 stop:458 length:345 start_codon:yes stop_codon:yes gene_type:complete
MAITTTWSVSNMTRVDADGGVITAYWQLLAASDGEGSETASEGGKARFEYDASSNDFIPYADLKENDVLGWIWESAKESDETAEEFKARIESERTAKVQAQIDRKAEQATGVPW